MVGEQIVIYDTKLIKNNKKKKRAMIDVMMILFHDFRKFVYLKNVAQKFDKIYY